MWLRRLLLIPLLLAVAALGAYVYVFNDPQPDARLACYYGAYDLDDGRIVVISPSSGAQALRFVFMDGITGRLEPVAKQGSEVPRAFAGRSGWSTDGPKPHKASFGPCDGTMALSVEGKAFSGTKRSFDMKDVTFENHGLKLFGRLTMPRVEGPVPVAVLVHGSERDSAVVFNRLQYLFPANGIGVFAYDKRGTGRSDGRYTQNFHLLSDDAAAALKKARELVGALAREVGFQGGSQAGWIQPLAATKVKADFVLVGFGLAESPLAEDREEVFDDLREAGYGHEVIAKAREITDATGRVMASNFTAGFDALDAVRAKYSKEQWYAKIKGEYSGDFLAYPNWVLQTLGPVLGVGTSWDYDPVPALQVYQGPHLWILAGRDSSGPSENTMRILREVQATHPNLDIVMFPTADHGITEFEIRDGERVDTRFSEGYLQLMVDWIHFKDPAVKAQGPVVYDGNAAAAATAQP